MPAVLLRRVSLSEGGALSNGGYWGELPLAVTTDRLSCQRVMSVQSMVCKELYDDDTSAIRCSGVWQAHAATGPGQSHSYARKCKFCSVPEVRKTSNLFCWAGAGKRDCLMLLIPPCMPAFERAGFV